MSDAQFRAILWVIGTATAWLSVLACMLGDVKRDDGSRLIPLGYTVVCVVALIVAMSFASDAVREALR